MGVSERVIVAVCAVLGVVGSTVEVRIAPNIFLTNQMRIEIGISVFIRLLP